MKYQFLCTSYTLKLTPLEHHVLLSLGRCISVVLRLATGWTVRGSHPVGGEIFSTRPDPAPYILVTGSFPLVMRPVRGVNRPILSSAEVKESV